MDLFDKSFENIIKLIEINELKPLQNYIQDNNIQIEKFNNSFFDILIYSIESQASIQIINFIIQQCSYTDLNYTFYDNGILKNIFNFSYKHHISDNGWKVPLFSAIAFDNYEIANFLIRNKADINYITEVKKSNGKNILQYLEHIYYLNSRNLNYILNHGFQVQGITSDLMNKLICLENDEGFLEIIFKHYIFNNSFILGFLYLYKNRTPLSKKQIKQIIIKEKSKIKIKKNMYQNAFILCFERMDIIELLMEHDIRDQTTILNQINMYVLLENALFLQSLKMVKKILSNTYVTFDIKKLENIFIHEISNNRYENLKYALEILDKNCSFNISQLNFESLLLRATMDNPLYNKYKEIKDVNQKIIILLLEFILNVSLNNIEKVDIVLLKNMDVSYLVLILNALIILQKLPLIKLLLENEELRPFINLNISDKNNKYPIFTALFNTYNEENYFESLKIFEYLLVKGANCIVKENGETLWSSVIRSRNYITIKCLLNHCNLLCERQDQRLLANDANLTSDMENNDDDIIFKIYDYPENGKSLINAICLRDLNTVQVLIQDTKSKEYKDILYSNSLIVSYLMDRKEILKWLVENVNINKYDQFGNTILFYAIVKGDLDMVNFLIEKNVDVNIVYYKNKDILKDDVNIKNNKQWYSALDFGFKKYLSMIESIYNSNNSSKINNKNFNYNCIGDSSLHVSINSANKDIFYSLLNHSDIDIDTNNEQEETPMMSIIKNQYFSTDDKMKMIELLINKGANVQYINNKNKKSTLAYAIQYHSLPIIKLLIKYGAKFNINMNELEQKQSLIIFTIAQGDIEIYKYFVESMNKDLYHDKNFVCSLMKTFNKDKNIEIFKYLIRNMIDINNVSCDILPVIISVNHLELLKLFVEYGLDLKEKSKDFGEKALQYAISNEVLSIAEYLIENGVDSSCIKS